MFGHLFRTTIVKQNSKESKLGRAIYITKTMYIRRAIVNRVVSTGIINETRPVIICPMQRVSCITFSNCFKSLLHNYAFLVHLILVNFVLKPDQVNALCLGLSGCN